MTLLWATPKMITLFLRDSLAGDNLYTYDHDNKTTSSSSFVKLISANCFHGVIPPGTTHSLWAYIRISGSLFSFPYSWLHLGKQLLPNLEWALHHCCFKRVSHLTFSESSDFQWTLYKFKWRNLLLRDMLFHTGCKQHCVHLFSTCCKCLLN